MPLYMPQHRHADARMAQAWCAQRCKPIPKDWFSIMDSWPRKEELPGDLVDGAKLYIWIRDVVTPKAPTKGKRVTQQKMARVKAEAEGRTFHVVGKDGLPGKADSGMATVPNAKDEDDAANRTCIRVVTGWTDDEASDADSSDEGDERDHGAMDFEEASDAAEEGCVTVAQLSLSSRYINTYVSAIMRLYTFQRDININPRDQSPRTQMLKDYLKQLTNEKYATMRANFDDRLELTIRDTYSQLEIPNHTRAAWQWETKRTVPQALRTSVDFLLGTHLAKRPGERSALEMPDLFSIDLPAHYRQRRRQLPTARCIVTVMRQGKRNTDARIQYGGALRHRDPFSCLVGAISFWYFWRFELEKEPLPNFSDRKTWYKVRLLRRSRHVRDSKFTPSPSRSRSPCLLQRSQRIWLHSSH